MSLRDVVFDLGGVLIDWDPRYLFRDHLGGESEEVEVFLAEVCTEQWHGQLDSGASFAVLTRELAGQFPRQGEWIGRYALDWERMFAGPFADSVAFLDYLIARGHRVHALSNYPAEHIRFLYRAFPFMAKFHTVVLSGLVRAVKPDESLFMYTLERIGRRDCVFIDDREENVVAARRCGMHAVRFVRGSGFGDLARLVESGTV